MYLLPVSMQVAVILALLYMPSFSQSASLNNMPVYYGYYFVEDPAKNQDYIDEVKGFTNIINVRYDNGAYNSWDRMQLKK